MAQDYSHLFGIGKGDSQIFDSSGTLNAYQRQLYQAQKQREAEDEALAKFTADFDANGVRDADSPIIADKYEKILDLNKAYQNTSDKKERINLKAQLQKQKADLEQSVVKSKNAKELEKQYGQLTLSDKRDLLQDGFVDKYGKLRQTSIFSDDYNTLANDSIFQNPYRETLWDAKNEEDIITRSVNPVKREAKENGRFVKYEGKELNEKTLYDQTLVALQGNEGRRLAKFIYTNYGTKGDGTADPADVQAYVKDLYSRNKGRFVVGKTTGAETLTTEQKEQIRSKYDKSGSENMNLTLGNAGQIPFGGPDKKSGVQPVVEPRNFLRFSPTRVNMAGTKAYDMNNGETVSIPNMADGVSISAIGDFPFIKSDAKFTNPKDAKLRGSIAQPDFVKKYGDKGVEYRRGAIVSFNDGYGDVQAIVPVESLPRNKAINAAISTIEKQAPRQKTQPKAKTTSKSEANPLGIDI